MKYLNMLRCQGLCAELVEPDTLRIFPAKRLTRKLKRFIIDHKMEIIVEIRAYNRVWSQVRPIRIVWEGEMVDVDYNGADGAFWRQFSIALVHAYLDGCARILKYREQ